MNRSLEDSGGRPQGGLDGYQTGKPAVLDHLVPIGERKEDAPALLYQDEADINHEELDCMREAWQDATDRASSAQELWTPSLLQQLSSCFAQIVREQTPTEEDGQNRREILQQLDDIVQTGLPDYPGLGIQPYGSYVSGLYCPSGDLDLSIEGTPIDGRAAGKPVKDIGKGGKADLLRTLSKKLERRRLHSGWIERILHARVPILKFTCRGVACDVSIGSSNAIFKAKTFKALAAREPRFAGMLRLVKAWAGVFGLNDAAEGTFNSFALGLMLIFHLQTCEPAVLPPLHELFEDSCNAISSRPIHMGCDISWPKLEVFERCTGNYPASQNRHGLAQLMGSFFSRFHAALLTWQHRDLSASVRASTWCGQWSYGQWEKSYIAAVEDPFDATDNCARTIGFSKIDSIVTAFGRAAAVMDAVRDEADAQAAMQYLFRGVPPLTMPPLPILEIRNGSSRSVSDLLAKEAESRRWRKQQYARDNSVIGGRAQGVRRSGREGAPGRQPSQPAASPGESGHEAQSDHTPLRIPKFARQAQGFRQSPAFRVASPHLLASAPSPATPPYDSSAPGYDRREHYPSHSLSSLLGSSHPLTSPGQTWADPESCFYQVPTDPSNQSPKQRVMGIRKAGPAQMQAHAAYEAALSALAQPPPAHALTQQQPGQQNGPARRAPPPGFGTPPPAGNVVSSPAEHASQPAQHSPAAPVPTRNQQANQALSDELKRMLHIGQPASSAATPPTPPSIGANGRAHAEARGSESADDGYGGYQRRRPQQRRPEKSAALGSGSPAAQGSPVMPVHGTVAFAHAGAATPSQAQRKRKVHKPANGQGRGLPAGVPVKSAAEAFVENDLSASTVQRKPRKAAPVTVQ
ncbi:hypothetical protein CVIRNUC_011003 [Coccomyxa viridis]|uniref:Poly(A) RNA polymerase mitochondrial-like central palm domain-containing protein n=1 Tax=Coccomyxa viridis TaxID=1274662 RepID=A0AAV1ILU4_9CHLO|nr:hypothetical protein CVIRNUC_011003 [Coccomyxa viridis]